MSDDTVQPEMSLSQLFAAASGVSYEEIAAQTKATQEDKKAAYEDPNLGKIKLVYKKQNNKFLLPNPADLHKEEDKRGLLPPAKRIAGIVTGARIGMTNWDSVKGTDIKGPGCQTVSYQSQSLDPATRMPTIVQGRPSSPMNWPSDFIGRYKPNASRREEIVTAGGTKATVRTTVTCLDCITRSENEVTDDGWFKKCKSEGEIDFMVTHVAGELLEAPMMTVIQVSSTSLREYAKYVQTGMSTYGTSDPSSLLVELSVTSEVSKGGDPYEMLHFQPIDKLRPDVAQLVGKAFMDFRTTHAALLEAGKTAIAAPAAQPALTAGNGAGNGTVAPF